MLDGRQFDLRRSLLVAGLYFLTGVLGEQLAAGSSGPTLIFPPAGIAVGAVLLWGYGVWPGVFLGAVLLASRLYPAYVFPIPLIVCPGVAVAVPWLLQRLAGFRFQLQQMSDVLLLTVGALLAGTLSATASVPLLTWLGVSDMQWEGWLNNWGTWWLGDTTAVLLIAPAFLAWKDGSGRMSGKAGRVEGVLALVALTLVCCLVYSGWLGQELQSVSLVLAPYPVLIWIGTRLNIRAATLALLIVATISIHGTAHQHGPFGAQGLQNSLALLAAFLAAAALSILLLSVSLSESRLAWQRLAAQSDLLRNILIQLPGAVYWKDRNDTYQGCNLQFAKLVGVEDPALVVGRQSAELPDSRILKLLDGAAEKRMLQTREAELGREVSFSDSAGQRLTYLINKVPLLSAAGDVVGLVGSAVEITQQVQIAEALRNSEAMKQALLRGIPDLVFRFDRAGVCLDYHSPAIQELRTPPERFVGHTLYELFPVDVAEKALRAIQRALDTGGLMSVEYQLAHNQKVEHHEARVLPSGAEEVVLIDRNVTQRKLAQQTAEESHRRLLRIVENLPAGAVYLEGEELHYNDAVVEITGYPHGALQNREQWFTALYGSRATEIRRRYEANRAAGFPHSREVKLTRRDGTERWVVVSCYGDDQGEIWLFHDVTERHQAEAALRSRELELAHVTRLSTMGEMVAEIAHEINQPLYAIENFSAACLTTLESLPEASDTPLKNWLEKIHTQADQAAKIIRRLRQLAAPTPPQATELNLREVLEEVLELLASDARKHGVEVRTVIPADLPLVIADHVQVEQVLINLVKNAHEALQEVSLSERQVTIELIPREKLVEIVVVDTGPGFTAEAASRMFDAFYTTKSRGMGMGLPICRSLIMAQGGKLWTQPAQPHGAQMHFTLPRKYATEKSETGM